MMKFKIEQLLRFKEDLLQLVLRELQIYPQNFMIQKQEDF